MTDFREELLELRKQFEKIDTSDPEAIRKWFADHPYLTTNDHAQVAGKSRWFVRSLRKKAGLTKKPPKTIPKPKQQKKITNIDTTNWDTKEWLERALKLYPQAQIAKAVNRDRKTIRARMKKWGIEPKSLKEITKPTNPCCNKEWVYNHYVEKELSQQQCADLAGTSLQNFANWLVRFEIQVRHRGQLPATPFWVRKLVYDLEQQPVVRTVFLRSNHIHIRTMNYFWESYYPDREGKRLPLSYNITKEDARLEKVPPTTYQYESELDGTNKYPGHLQIDMKQWKQASLMERRIALHQFSTKMFEAKYVQLTHPEHVIQHELEFMRKIDAARFIKDAGFTAFPRLENTRHAPGKKIMQHFFDLSYLWEQVFNSPRCTTHVLNELAKRSTVAFNTHHMIRTLVGEVPNLSHKVIPRMPNPMVYAVIMRRLGIRGPVLDLHPGYGSRATACAILGIPYLYQPNEIFQGALDRGFAEFVGLDCQPYGGGKVPMLLCDNDLNMPNMKDVIELSKSASNMLVFIPSEKREQVQNKLKPKSVIPIKARFHKKKMDYFFLY